MKRLFTLLLVSLIGMSYAQEAPEAVLKTFNKRYSRVKDVKWEKKMVISDTVSEIYQASFDYRDVPTVMKYTPKGYWLETMNDIPEKELRQSITDYIYKNHYEDDLVVARKIKTFDKKDYFYVKLKRMKRNQFHPYFFELWFDRRGVLEKIIRPKELKSEFLLTAEIPKEIATDFNKRFRKPADAKWKKEGSFYVSNFVYREIEKTAYYSSDSLKWVKVIEKPDLKKGRLYSPVVRYCEKNYPKYKMVEYKKVVLADKTKSFFSVKLRAKKKKSSSQEIELLFNKSGKLID